MCGLGLRLRYCSSPNIVVGPSTAMNGWVLTCACVAYRQVQLRLVGYACLAIVFSMLGESIPIYAAMPVQHHGLGWSSMQLAAPMSVGGLSLMGSATLLYPRVSKAVGVNRCAILVSTVCNTSFMLYWSDIRHQCGYATRALECAGSSLR